MMAPMNRAMRQVSAALPLALLLACAPRPGSPVPLRCPAGASEMVRDVLYFGRSIPGGGEVTDSAWRAFLAEVVTPAFPDGLTVTEGTGQWRGADGKVISERNEILTLLHSGSEADEAKVLQIAERYRTTFRQEAVLHEHSMVCVSFEKGGR
jgi:hypothetical protein